MARSLEQIQQQIAKLQVQARALKEKEVDGVVARIREAIAYYELTPQDLFGSSRRKRAGTASAIRDAGPKASKGGQKAIRKSVPVKYRDEDGNTWTGRGHKPRWLAAELAAGKKLEDFLVKDA